MEGTKDPTKNPWRKRLKKKYSRMKRHQICWQFSTKFSKEPNFSKEVIKIKIMENKLKIDEKIQLRKYSVSSLAELGISSENISEDLILSKAFNSLFVRETSPLCLQRFKSVFGENMFHKRFFKELLLQ